MKNNGSGRDFIDFLILVYRRQKIFYFMVCIFILLAFYFNNYLNTTYKFDMELQVSLKDNYFKTDNFQRQLNKVVNEVSSAADSTGGTDLEALNSLLWSRDQVRVLIKTLPMNGIFFSELASEYIKTNNLVDRIEVEEKINSSLSYRDKGDYGLIVNVALDDIELAIFLQENFIILLEKHISERMKTHLLNLKDNALILFTSKANIEINKRIFLTKEDSEIDNKDQIIKQLLSDPIRYSAFSDPYYYITSMVIPGYDLPYIDNTQTKVVKSNRVNTSFVYLFMIFIALFIHIVISIFVDLLDQIKKRIKEQ